MPNLDLYIRQAGLEIQDFLVCTSVCCPSRTNLLTVCLEGGVGGCPSCANVFMVKGFRRSEVRSAAMRVLGLGFRALGL